MEEKDSTTMVSVRWPIADKERLQAVAAERGMSFTQLMLDGTRLLAGFDPGFLRAIQATADATRLDIPTVVTQLLTYYLAVDSAISDTFGKRTATLAKAFRSDADGLIVGDKLHDLCYAEAMQELKGLRDKLTPVAGGKPGLKKGTRVSTDEGHMMARASVELEPAAAAR